MPNVVFKRPWHLETSGQSREHGYILSLWIFSVDRFWLSGFRLVYCISTISTFNFFISTTVTVFNLIHGSDMLPCYVLDTSRIPCFYWCRVFGIPLVIREKLNLKGRNFNAFRYIAQEKKSIYSP